MTFVLMLLIALLPILIYTILYLSVQAQVEAIRAGRLQTPQGQAPVTEESVRAVLTGLRPDRAAEFALGMTAFVGAIFTTILAGSVMGNEFGWSTVRTVLAHGGRRAAFIFGKLAALGLTAVAFVLIGFVATFIAAYGLGIVANLDLSLSADLPSRIAGYVVRGVYVALPYLTFAVLMAVLARSAAAGIAFGLVLFFGESLVAQLAIQLNSDLRPVFDAGIARNVSAIARTPSSGQGPPTVMPSATELAFAVGILALYVVAFTSLAIHRFAKRDLTLA
jgi:ABC-type transport system involved in multi-copper enzyme maturation permease subunit